MGKLLCLIVNLLSRKAVDDFQLTILEGDRFLPEISPVNPSSLLKDTFKETLPWAIAKRCCEAQIAVSSEKARSEGIINPVLLEVKRQLNGQISAFSGEEFNVQPEVYLTGYVDFLISRSPKFKPLLHSNSPLKCCLPNRVNFSFF
ncbi:hypothetical protein [Planktothrix sp. FACHB-1365]|uniref:hypothetical protein n=1 Tax=Planktothrix sp. FACHB-1365 TaxID=2692855 RepID=UPI0018EF561C|nr:hypothetical protein [Planktothrix sp. FACHB-1365]